MEESKTFSAFVPGTAKAQGSTSSFLVNRNQVMQGARANIVTTSASKGLKGWRETMKQHFDITRRQQKILEPMDGPLCAQYVFIVARLAGHPKTKAGRRMVEGGLDLDKMIRAVNDSLTDAKVIVDDKRICAMERPVKRYAQLEEVPGVIVRVWKLSQIEIEELGNAI